MRIYLPILAAVLAICLFIGPFIRPFKDGAVMQPPLEPDVLRNVYRAGAAAAPAPAPAAPEDKAMSHSQPTTAAAATPSTVPVIAEIQPAQ
jgi:hypothetical protein